MGNVIHELRDLMGISEADPVLQKVANVVQGKSMMSLRTPLQSIFKKKDIDFGYSPMPHFAIKYKGKKIIIANKNNVDEPEMVVGELAIGYL